MVALQLLQLLLLLACSSHVRRQWNSSIYSKLDDSPVTSLDVNEVATFFIDCTDSVQDGHQAARAYDITSQSYALKTDDYAVDMCSPGSATHIYVRPTGISSVAKRVTLAVASTSSAACVHEVNSVHEAQCSLRLSAAA